MDNKLWENSQVLDIYWVEEYSEIFQKPTQTVFAKAVNGC